MARAHLGTLSRVYYAPDIPADKLRRAKAAHERHLDANETIQVLYDDTVFGGGKNGWILTDRRIAWKDLLDSARFLYWQTLTASSVRRSDTRLFINGGRLPIGAWSADRAQALETLLLSVVRMWGATTAGPYRGGDVIAARPLPLGVLLELAREHLRDREHLYIGPALPPRKLRNARAVHAAALAEDDPIAVLYDDTLFGGAKEGFIITPSLLCWKNMADAPIVVPWGQAQRDTIYTAPSAVFIAGGKIDVVMAAGQVKDIAALLGAIVDRVNR